jgi:hypothetical protein
MQENGKSYPTTTIRIKPKESKISDDPQVIKDILQNQKDITELYEEMSYVELKSVLENWLNPSTEKVVAPNKDSQKESDVEQPAPKKDTRPVSIMEDEDSDLPWEQPAKKGSVKDEVASAFDDLFN